MGWTLTGTVQFRFNETPTDISAYGNTVAWCCPCGTPILFVYDGGKPGSSSDKPTRCHGCEALYFLDPPCMESCPESRLPECRLRPPRSCESSRSESLFSPSLRLKQLQLRLLEKVITFENPDCLHEVGFLIIPVAFRLFDQIGQNGAKGNDGINALGAQ